MTFFEAFLNVLFMLTMSMTVLLLLVLATHVLTLIISALVYLGIPFLVGLAQIAILVLLATTLVYWLKQLNNLRKHF